MRFALSGHLQASWMITGAIKCARIQQFARTQAVNFFLVFLCLFVLGDSMSGALLVIRLGAGKGFALKGGKCREQTRDQGL